MLRTSIEHNQRLNLIGAVCVSPSGRKLKLCLQSAWQALNGEHVIAFLKHLLRQVRGPLVMVWDRHPIHRRRKVKAFLAAHPRIHVYLFPTCAPELNPAEFVWTQVSEYTANMAPHDKAELWRNVQAGISRTRRSQRRLRACLDASGLTWTC